MEDDLNPNPRRGKAQTITLQQEGEVSDSLLSGKGAANEENIDFGGRRESNGSRRLSDKR